MYPLKHTEEHVLLQRMWQLENSLNGYVDLTNRLFDTVEQSQANAEDYKRLWKAEAYSFEVAAAEASVMIDQLQSQIADPQNLIETAHTCLNPGAARKVSLPALGMHCWCGFQVWHLHQHLLSNQPALTICQLVHLQPERFSARQSLLLLGAA